MRINLNCPFDEREHAKRLGARWDAARKTRYIEGVEDITDFMRWIDRPAHVAPCTPVALSRTECGIRAPAPRSITLTEYLVLAYPNGVKALSAHAARAFGIAYPLPAGWVDTYAQRTISMAQAGQLVAERHAPKKPGKQKAAPVSAPVPSKSQRRKAARREKKAAAASSATAARQTAMLDAANHAHIASLLH